MVALHDLAKVGDIALVQEVELPDVFRALAQHASNAVDPHLSHQHTLSRTDVSARIAGCQEQSCLINNTRSQQPGTAFNFTQVGALVVDQAT